MDEDILDELLHLLNCGNDAEKERAFNQLQAIGYFTEHDTPETWWLDVSTESTE